MKKVKEFIGEHRGKMLTLFIVASLVLAYISGNNVVVQDDYYVGNVISFGEIGLFWKSQEGEFAIGGLEREQTGYFSVDNRLKKTNPEKYESIVRDLNRALRHNLTVRVHGICNIFCYPWRSLWGYHVDEVEFLEKE